MTLEQVYHLGELVGVVAVVIGLVFVIKELRQNTDQLRIGASNEWLNLQFKLSTGVAENREVAELWVSGSDDDRFEALDNIDQQRLIMFEHRAISGWSNLFEMHQQGLLPDAQWQELKGLMSTLGRRRAIRESWRVFRHSFSEPFQTFASPYLD